MSQDIIFELHFLFHSFLMGILITVLYDFLRILRRVIPHNIVLVSLEDFLYWLVCSLMIFVMLVREHNGILRWFAVAGAMTGMLLYKKTLGNLFVKYSSMLLCWILHLVGKVLCIILKPLNVVARRASRVRRYAQKPLKMGLRGGKKKLTEAKKLLKMILCKQ